MFRSCSPNSRRGRAPAALPLAACLAACAHPPAVVAPPGSAAEVLVAIDEGSCFALAGDAQRVAFVRGGLRLLGPGSAAEQELTSERPTALEWSPDGRILAAAFARPLGAELRLLDSTSGRALASATVSGEVAALHWVGKELWAAATEMQRKRFGTVLSFWLHAWAAPRLRSTRLGDTVLRPHRSAASAQTFRLAISATGDEVVYLTPRQPPAVAPYRALLVRHLGTGVERQAARVDWALGGLALQGICDERLLVGDGRRMTWTFEPWGTKRSAAIASAGRVLASSATGRNLLVDGVLYRDRRRVADLGAGRGQFSARGDRLLFEVGRHLVLLTGLPPDPPERLPSASAQARLLQLRRWRSQGLIAPDDYRRNCERIFGH